MKNVQISSRKLMIAFLGLVLSLSSCDYLDIADAKYPDQLIYMPAARHNIFYINSVASPIGNTTPGSNYRYIVDITGNGFKIPLGVYRSGIDNKGAFKVDIITVTDTIAKLQAPGQPLEGTKILSPALFTIPNSIEMRDGEELAPFDLTVRLDSLMANYSKNTVFAIGVRISSTARDTNPDLATTIVVIDSKMMKPTAGFTFKPDDTNPKKVAFTNESLMGLTYEWDFGDNTTSTETSPVHTFSATGTFTVKLKALGVTGEQDKSIKSIDVTIL